VGVLGACARDLWTAFSCRVQHDAVDRPGGGWRAGMGAGTCSPSDVMLLPAEMYAGLPVVPAHTNTIAGAHVVAGG
jgi:hypothetical protein